MPEIATLNIYTAGGILTFDVAVTSADFEDTIAAALEEGTPTLTLADGGYLILSGMNFVAIEIKRTPPQK